MQEEKSILAKNCSRSAWKNWVYKVYKTWRRRIHWLHFTTREI